MEEQTPKRNGVEEALAPEQRNELLDMQDIRKQQYEQAMERLERFKQQSSPGYTTAIGKDKYTFALDKYGEPFLSKKEPLSPGEEKDMHEISNLLRVHWDVTYNPRGPIIQENVSTDKDEQER